MTERLAVNEIFGPTCQGEGKSAGMVCAFLRLTHCNLSCSWCDTSYTWDWTKHDRTAETHPMEVDAIMGRLYHHSTAALRFNSFGIPTHMRNLVISGGEPMLQQKRLVPLLERLRDEKWWVEVETNGTINPTPTFLALVSQINCSPKLTNSGEPMKRRVNELALRLLGAWPRTNFKFVIEKAEDIEEVIDLIVNYRLEEREIYLMPQGSTREELARTEPIVSQLVADQINILTGYVRFKFAPRLHIAQYGGKRGV